MNGRSGASPAPTFAGRTRRGARATARAWPAAASNGRWETGTRRLARRRFDALASNPPYIAADDPVLAGDGLRHEPRSALTPGGDGTSASATLINGRTAAPACRAAGWRSSMAHTQGETLRVRCLWRVASLT